MAKALSPPMPHQHVLFLRRSFARARGRVSLETFVLRFGTDARRMRDLLNGRTFVKARGPLASLPPPPAPYIPSQEEVERLRRAYRRNKGRVTVTKLAEKTGIGIARMRQILVGDQYGDKGAVRALFSKGAPRSLTDAQVVAMRDLYRNDEAQTIQTLSAIYGMTDKGIAQVLTGRTYKHVPGALAKLRPATWPVSAKIASQKARRRFTAEQVIEARRDYDPPRVTAKALADRLGANVSTIIDMVSGRSYPEIAGAREIVKMPFLSPTPDLTFEQVVSARDLYARGMRQTIQIARRLGITRRQTERMLYGHTHREWPGALEPGTKPKRVALSNKRRAKGVRKPVQPVRPDHAAARFVADA